MVMLTSAVAVAIVHRPDARLAVLDRLTELAGHHRLGAVWAHLSEMAAAAAEAHQTYRLPCPPDDLGARTPLPRVRAARLS